MPLNFRPGNLLPGRHQVLRVLCLGSLPLTHHFTFQNTGSTSAYPRHYPGPWLLRASFSPLASGWHLLRGVIHPTEGHGREVTPFPVSIARILRRAMLSTGVLWQCRPVSSRGCRRLILCLLAPAHQPLALAVNYDGSTASSLSLSIDTC